MAYAVPNWCPDPNFYHTLEVQLHHPPTMFEYNEGIRWVNAASGTNYPLATVGGATTTPPLAPPSGGGTTGGGNVVTGPSGEDTSQAYNQFVLNWQYQQEEQRRENEAAMARTQASVSASLAAAQASAQAQLEAQREADRAALERLRYQLGNDLASALMANDQNMFQRTMDTAELAADPRSIVGFLEFLGRQGGGPTAMSQGLVAGMTPSPVWDVIPQTQGLSPEVQSLIDLLQGFIGGGAPAGAAGPGGTTPGVGYSPAAYGRARVGTIGGTKTW